jgi:uncharacterized membrane protein YdjX (TVP38/TMEM64 family)
MTSLMPIGSARSKPRKLQVAMLILAAAAAVAVAFMVRAGFEPHALAVWIDSRRAVASEHPAASALTYFAMYCGFAALSLPGIWVVSVAGGALFGPWLGAPLVVLSYTSGATLAMLLSRRVLREWVTTRFAARVDAVNASVEREGARWLLAARLTPAIPYFLINLAVGVTRMPAIVFAAVSAVGALPLAILCVLAGSKLATLEHASDVASAPVLIALAGLGLATLGLGPLLRRRAAQRARVGGSS